jgi:digeranylgeranylglycerophospholipid reductase
MKDRFDVIIVGAGPAGSMAAQILAEKGIHTLLLEKHKEIGLPVCCAEAISYTGLSNFVEIKPHWIATHINKALLVSPSGERTVVNHPKAGFVLNRNIFDREMAEKASNLGAVVKTDVQAVGLIEDKNGIFSGVEVKENNIEKNYFAKVIIGADGVESLVGRWAGMNTYLGLGQIESAAQYFLKDIAVDPECLEFHLGTEIVPGGYAWVFPKGENCANVGLAVAPLISNGSNPFKLLDNFVQKRFSKFFIDKITMGGVPTFDRKKNIVKGNVLLVGDAGRLIDSLSGAGISNALMSGQIAGEIVAEHFKNGSISFLGKYEQEILKKKGRELRFYSFCRSVYLKFKDEEFDLVIKFLKDYLGEKKLEGIEPISLVKSIFKFNPKLVFLLRHLIW